MSDYRAEIEMQAAEADARVAVAELHAALDGIVPDTAAIVADLNVSRFLDEDGNVDAGAVAALKERYAAMAPVRRIPLPNPAQGVNVHRDNRDGQLGNADLARMTTGEINEAMDKGRFNDLLAGRAV